MCIGKQKNNSTELVITSSDYNLRKNSGKIQEEIRLRNIDAER